MILLIDAGNTRIKWAVIDGENWVSVGVMPHDSATTALRAIVKENPLLTHVLCANVAGLKLAENIRAAFDDSGLEFEWLQASTYCCGVSNHYENPAQLGVDRWAAVIGAHALHQGACLVVNAGTATTIDILDADGNFQGGMILPGKYLMRQALSRFTAQLPLSDGNFTNTPRNTADAIFSGCMVAHIGAIEHMFNAAIAGMKNATCVLSGGAGSTVAAYLGIPCTYVENLVLKGLYIIARDSMGQQQDMLS